MQGGNRPIFDDLPQEPDGSNALSARTLEAAARHPPDESHACGRCWRTRSDANPVVGTNKAEEEISRDRVLNDEELRLVWSCAGEGDYGAIIRLLILPGSAARKSPRNLWRIGAERTKNGLLHEVPLPKKGRQGIEGAWRARRPRSRLRFT